DDGATWERVHSIFNGAVRASFFDDLDGRLAILHNADPETALLISDDQGATWAETTARIPNTSATGVARIGDTYVVVGGAGSYRSTDGGASWAILHSSALSSVVSFGGSFY